jgi:uncharacterized protein
MKQKYLFLFICLLSICIVANAQTKKINVIQDIKNWQQQLNNEYKNKPKSPLSLQDIKLFSGHNFFKIDTAYRVNATLVLRNDSTEIPFKTSTSRVLVHTKYADAYFTIKGQKFVLSIYQSKALMNNKEFVDFLFLPFIDATSGNETYGGGRYIDLKIPASGNKIVIDFNKAYNPYCAYSKGFSCPKVPEGNELPIKILAGILYSPLH